MAVKMPVPKTTVSVKLKWFGESAPQAIRKALAPRMLAAAVMIQDRLIQKLSTPVFPRSRPYEYPHMETTKLIRGLFARQTARDGVFGYDVGSDALHSAFLNLGTRRMAPRPFLRLVLAEMADQLGRFVARPVSMGNVFGLGQSQTYTITKKS